MNISSLIIGLGHIGMKYDLKKDYIFTHSKALANNKNFSLVAGVDLFIENRKIFQEKYQRPTFSNIKSASKVVNPELVVVATPTNKHKHTVQEIVKYLNPKIILCEKPIANNVDDAKEILQLCKKKNIKVFVNYFRRFEKSSLKIKKILEKEDGLIKGNVWYSNGLINNGSHFLNLTNFWFGQIKKYFSFTKLKKIRNHDFNLDFKVVYKTAEINFISLSYKKFSHNTIELILPDKRIFYENEGFKIVSNNVIKDKKFDGYYILDTKTKYIDNGLLNYQKNVYNNLHNFITNKKANISCSKDAMTTLQVINKLKDLSYEK